MGFRFLHRDASFPCVQLWQLGTRHDNKIADDSCSNKTATVTTTGTTEQAIERERRIDNNNNSSSSSSSSTTIIIMRQLKGCRASPSSSSSSSLCRRILPLPPWSSSSLLVWLATVLVLTTTAAVPARANSNQVVPSLAPTSASSAVTTKTTEGSTKEELAQQRIDYVLSVLVQRFDHVSSGKRAKVFAQWAAKQGDLKVLSTHGVEDIDLSLTKTDTPKSEGEVENDKEQHQQTRPGKELAIFPQDPLDLDFVKDEVGIPANQFSGKPQHLIDSRSSNVVELFLRSIKLALNFAPVSTTAWLAFFSSSFRSRVWYHWVTGCLAASGPAFIKWGKHLSTNWTVSFPGSFVFHRMVWATLTQSPFLSSLHTHTCTLALTLQCRD